MGRLNFLPIISGMIATADVLTGKKTILSYLLKTGNRLGLALLINRG